MPADEMKREIDALKEAVRTLSDGKWDKRDLSAIVVLLGAMSGLAAGALLLAERLGLL